MIDLEIEKSTSNGYDKEYHPKNLLNTEKYRLYQSHDLSTLSANDYIIFTTANSSLYDIKQIKIRNRHDNKAIKDICIHLGNFDSILSGKWYSSQRVLGIEKEWNQKDQYFDFESKLCAIRKNKLNVIKLEILKNYGNETHNSFNFFGLYGLKI
eukprot:78367_1